jgi:ribonuclease HI
MELTAAIKALQWLWEKYSGNVWQWTEADVQD